MEGILKVAPEVLISTAGEFATQGSQIGSLTAEMIELINGLPSTWIGDASTAYIAKFNGLQDDIQRILNMVNEHSADLEEMATQYIDAESQITEITQSLSSDVIV